MKKITLLKVLSFIGGIFLYFVPANVNAQANIGPLATVTASTCNTGTCGDFNDLSLGVCGTQDVWVTTSTPPSTVAGTEYIEFTFSLAKTFDTLVIHHGDDAARFLTGALVQYWNGTTWVNHTTFSSLPQVCINRIGIGKLTTDQFRLTSFEMTGTGQQSNPNFREIEVIEAPSGLNDAAVLSVDSPTVFCSGMNDVVATIGNLGINQIDSVDVVWEVNGVAQPTVSYKQLLDTNGGSNPTSVQLVLGTVSFNSGSNDILVYTTAPNGGVDTVNLNDTIFTSVQSAAAPLAVNILNQTLTSVDIEVVGAAGTIDYEYDSVGFTFGNGITGSSTNGVFTISGLSQGGSYEIYVRSNCGSGDTSVWVGPVSFLTSYGVPFLQDFENFAAGITGNPWAEGWTSTTTTDPKWESEDATTGNNENSTGTGPLYDHTLFPNTGGTYIYMETSSGTTGDSADFVSPPIYIDPSQTTVELSYWYFNFGTEVDRMDVVIDTNGVEEVIASYVGSQQTAQSDDWLKASHFLSGYAGKSVTIKFRGINPPCCGGDLAIDDVAIDSVAQLNAGVNEILEPGIGGALCAGLAPLKVVVGNKGMDDITSFSIVANINGIIDTSAFTLNISSGDTIHVNIGNATFTAGANSITAYTLDPNNGTDAISLDDTTSISVSTANPPTNFATSNETLNSVDISADNFADSLEIEYGLVGFTQGVGTKVSSNSVPFTITGLAQGTAYEAYIRAKCGSNDSSNWVGPVPFNTSYGIPYLQDFENFAAGITGNPWPEGWTSTTTTDPNWESEDATTGNNENSTGTGPLLDHTLYPNTGGTYVYMETSSGTVGDSADFVSPPIYIGASYSVVKLSYWYFNFGADIDRMDVLVDTNGVENLIASYIGSQQFAQTDEWLEGSAFLEGYQGKTVNLIFRGINVPCCSGDLAIDDVRIDSVPQLSAMLSEIIEPSGSLCGGNVNPIVVIGNGGIDTITYVDIVTDVNGVLDTTRYNGNLGIGDTAHVTLPAITISNGTLYDLQFYTIDPNGATDVLILDDTMKLNGLTTGLQGTITLDASLPVSATNYTSFTALANQLNAVGVCGNVTIDVASGTYDDVFHLTNVPGLSATNTLIIDGGDSSLVTLENNLSSERGVIALNASPYVTIKNMTLHSTYTGTLDHYGVHFTGATSHDSIVNCRVIMNPTNSIGAMGIGASSDITNDFGEGDNANYITVMNCAIDGGSYSIHFEGPTSGNWNVGNTFINNKLTNMDDYGIYTDQQDSMRIIGNNISGMRSTTGDGIACFDHMNFEINSNLVLVEDYGIYVTNANSGDDADREATLINNMVSSFGDYGIYLTNPSRINMYHNSVYSEGTISAVRFLSAIDSIDMRNNAIYSTNSEAFEMSGAADTTVFLKFDNNVFYTTGTSDLLDIGGAYTTLADYQTARPGYNINSLEGNPEFISDSNLHVVGVFMDEAGDNGVNILTDIDGDVRPSAFATFVDIGADEFDPPACAAPINVNAFNIGEDSASLTWTKSYGPSVIDYSLTLKDSSISSGTMDTTSVLDTLLFTGLTPNTEYDFYIREICRRGDTSIWAGPLTLKTPCGAFTAAYTNDFENDALNVTPDCWNSYSSYANGTAIVDDWTGTGAPYAGTQALYIYSSSGFTQNSDTLIAISPQFSDLPNGDKQISFWGNSDDPTTQLIVGTISSLDPTATFNVIDTITFAVADTYQEEIIPFTTANGYNGSDEYIVFAHDLTNTFDYIRIDEFNYEDIPSCPKPNDLLASVYSGDSASLGWVDNASASQWQIEYDVAPFTAGSGTDTIVNANPFELGGLTSNTLYEYRVRAICAAGDTSQWSSANGRFETPCATYQAPYSEDFENGGSIPSCMKQGVNNAENWIFATTGGHVGNTGTISGNSLSDGYFAYVDDSAPANLNTTLETPFVDVNGLTNPTLEFYRLSDNEGNLNGNVDFTVEVWDGSSWNQVYFADTNSFNEEWEFISIPLNTLTITGPVQARFIVDETNGTIFDDDVAIDDIFIGDRIPLDVGVIAIISPQSLSGNDSCNLGSAADLIVEVENFGTSLVDSLDISFVFNNGTAITQRFTNLNLNLANTAQLTFDSTIDLTTSGTYLLAVYTAMSGDGNLTNDTASITIINEGYGGAIVGNDSICFGDTTSISVEDAIGTLQWQELLSGVWTDISGADSLEIQISPSNSTDYRVLACGTAASDSFHLEVINLSAPTVSGDTVVVSCGGSGVATASASSSNSNPKFVWYDSPTASNPIDTSNAAYSINGAGDSLSYFKDTTVSGTPTVDTVWVSEVVGAGSGNNTLKITEADPGAPDALEIQNVSGQSVDVTGWTVAVSNSYTDINSVNGTTQTLSGTMTSGQVMYWTDGTVNAWGSNLLWNPGAYPTFTGWILIIDDLGNIVDFLPLNWTATDIATMSVTINGFTITPGTSGAWIGDGYDLTSIPAGSSVYRQGSEDTDEATDFITSTIDLGTQNTGLSLPFAGGECVGPKSMAILMIDCITGLENTNAIADNLTIYPNPSNGIFKLDISSENRTKYNLELRDLRGKIVYTNDVTVNGSYQERLDFSDFAKGVYFMQIRTSGTTEIRKLIIQ